MLTFILFVSLFSCSIERRLAKYCPMCTQKDSTVYITQYRDTTIKIPIETLFAEKGLRLDQDKMSVTD